MKLEPPSVESRRCRIVIRESRRQTGRTISMRCSMRKAGKPVRGLPIDCLRSTVWANGGPFIPCGNGKRRLCGIFVKTTTKAKNPGKSERRSSFPSLTRRGFCDIIISACYKASSGTLYYFWRKIEWKRKQWLRSTRQFLVNSKT